MSKGWWYVIGLAMGLYVIGLAMVLAAAFVMDLIRSCR